MIKNPFFSKILKFKKIDINQNIFDKNKTYFYIASIGILFFLGIALILPLSYKLFSLIFPKPASHAISLSPTPTPIATWSSIPVQIPILSTSLASLFNTLLPTDQAVFIFEGYQTPPLSTIKQGDVVYSWGSWADMEPALSTMSSQVSTVIYDPEHGSHTPVVEQNNLVASASAASAAVHALGRKFSIVPDSRFTADTTLISQLAPLADSFIIQAQKYQGNIPQFDSFINTTVQTLKAANPAIAIWVQIQVTTQTGVTTNYSPQTALTDLESISFIPAGVTVWTFSTQSTPTQQFMELLRPTITTTPTVTNTPTPTPNTIIGDINNDGVVNLIDLSILLSNLNQPITSANSKADLNNDGVINTSDYDLLISILQSNNILK